MTMKTLCLTAFVLLICVACAHAGTFELTVPVTGLYGSARTRDIDFGRQFTSISAMSIAWSGSVTPGWYSDPIEGISGPCGASFFAGLVGREGSIAWYASTLTLGRWTYPQPQDFSGITAFQQMNRHEPPSWDFLLDGTASMYVQISSEIYAGGGHCSPPPVGNLASVKVILDATVPEPQTAFCLASGLAALLLGLRRRALA